LFGHAPGRCGARHYRLSGNRDPAGGRARRYFAWKINDIYQNQVRKFLMKSRTVAAPNTKPQKTRIVIVEDELMLSGMLEAWLARFRDFEVVGCAADGEAGWELCRTAQPDLALVDIHLPKLDGLKLVQRLAHEFPQMRLLSMSGLMDAYTIWCVMQCGAHGYINKIQAPKMLTEAIRAVARGNTFFGPNFSQVKQEWLSRPEAFQKILSEREQQVLRGVVAGWEDERIGAELGISPATIEAHRKRIRLKLGVHSDRGLLAYARHWGLHTRISDK
jgi:DNA-binding NarL/FixJ family response regulator